MIETLEHKSTRLKKKVDLLKEENEMLRAELRVICTADQNLEKDFTDSRTLRFLTTR